MQRVEEAFPFLDYVNNNRYACRNIASTVLSHLPIGSKIWDFGAGPCDKTAVLSVLGYKCSAVDDLNDPWHLELDNREAILHFASEMGIDFTLSSAVPNFAAETFDLVILADIIEHLHDSPRVLLNSLLTKLRPGGLVLVTVPNAVNIRKRLAVLSGQTNYQPYTRLFWSDRWRGHVREYTKQDLSLLAEHIGLVCCELRACDHMLEKVPAPARRAYKAVTTWLTGWKDSWTLVAKKPANWRPRLAAPPLGNGAHYPLRKSGPQTLVASYKGAKEPARPAHT
jgi:SAM-dependent methyltransferase